MKKEQGSGSILEPRRRSFFRRGGAVAGAVVTGTTLSALSAHRASPTTKAATAASAGAAGAATTASCSARRTRTAT